MESPFAGKIIVYVFGKSQYVNFDVLNVTLRVWGSGNSRPCIPKAFGREFPEIFFKIPWNTGTSYAK